MKRIISYLMLLGIIGSFFVLCSESEDLSLSAFVCQKLIALCAMIACGGLFSRINRTTDEQS